MQMSKGPTDSAVLPVIALGLLKRMGKLRKKERPPKAVARQPSGPSIFSGLFIVASLLKTVAFIGLLLAYLVIEVFVAMLAYAYLNLNHVETFGYLVGLSGSFLSEMAAQLKTYSPDLANRAYATLLGEFGPKSILLLFIGLGVSMVIRFIVWLIHLAFGNMRSAKSGAATQQA
jgi:hypothetical protein